MPISRSMRPHYGLDWRAQSDQIRFERAGGRCERCRRPHHSLILCLSDGRWLDAEDELWRDGCGAPVDTPSLDALTSRVVPPSFTRVVIATAHLDHDPRNSGADNLAALCQRCHMLHDAEHHRRQRLLTLRSRWAVGDLFLGLYERLRYPLVDPLN